jgi:Uncharacterized protein conserved in bacteria (DUF2125)
VSVTMSEDYPMTISNTTDGVATEVSALLHQTGMVMTVSGTPDEMTYDVEVAKYAITLNSVTSGGTAVPAEIAITLNNMAGSFVTSTSDLHNVDYEVGAESADVSVVVNDPETGTAVNFSGKMNDLASTVNMAIPLDTTNPDEMFNAGMAMSGGYTFGASSFLFSANDPASGDTSGTATAISGSTDFSFDKSALGYDTTTQGLNVELTSAQMPFPVKLAMSELGLGILFPLAKSDAPSDWATYLNLSDLSVNDEIWAMLDAGNVLPHDPATVVLDLTGTATMLFDVLDPAQQEAMNAGTAPGELNSVAVNDLTVKIAGAEVTGTGAFTFDNTDTTTIPGMPRPQGTLDLNINGVNGLLDKLVSMGLIPEDQAMMPRMMMGMFATVVGDDQLTSKIEIDANGGIFANGQQIQ